MTATSAPPSRSEPPPTGQRERLLDGMARAVARRGYTDATVAQAIAKARVSRSTFYEHFADKEECFLAAFQELAPVLGEELLAAVADVPWERKQRAMLAAVLDPEQSDTAMHWRLLLTQARAGEPRVRAQRELFMARLEQSLQALLDGVPEQTPTLDIPPKALLGGVRSVISIQRYTHDAQEQSSLLDDLVAWTAAYAVPPGHARRPDAEWEALGRRLCATGDPASQSPRDDPAPPHALSGDCPAASEESPPKLPRGRGRLPAASVAGEHYNRIVRATARTMRAKGYAATTIADIVAAAGVSRGVFYGQFQNKQEVFLAAQTVTLQKGLTTASTAFFTGRTWPEQVWRGLDALLSYLAGLPDLAHLMLIEPYAAGPAALDRVIDTMRTLSLFLEQGYHGSGRAEQLPRLCSDAIAGAIHELFYHAAQEDRGIERLRELLPQCAYIALAPFLGARKARATVDDLLAASI